MFHWHEKRLIDAIIERIAQPTDQPMAAKPKPVTANPKPVAAKPQPVKFDPHKCPDFDPVRARNCPYYGKGRV